MRPEGLYTFVETKYGRIGIEENTPGDDRYLDPEFDPKAWTPQDGPWFSLDPEKDCYKEDGGAIFLGVGPLPAEMYGPKGPAEMEAFQKVVEGWLERFGWHNLIPQERWLPKELWMGESED